MIVVESVDVIIGCFEQRVLGAVFSDDGVALYYKMILHDNWYFIKFVDIKLEGCDFCTTGIIGAFGHDEHTVLMMLKGEVIF